jgi:hypothetical protein
MQRGIKKDSSLTKFVLGAHPIIGQFMEMLQIREIIGTYVRASVRTCATPSERIRARFIRPDRMRELRCRRATSSASRRGDGRLPPVPPKQWSV